MEVSYFAVSMFLYTVSWRYKWDYLYGSKDILCYIKFYIINTMIPRLYLRYKQGPDLKL